MIIAISGSRRYEQRSHVEDFIKSLAKRTDLKIIFGEAWGVDTWAKEACEKYSIPHEVYFADWDRLGRSAGPMRNSKLVMDATKVVCFWDGDSRGTADTIKKARHVDRLAFVFSDTEKYEEIGRMLNI